MIDSGSDPRKDGVSGIKHALDREVARRFDGERLASNHVRMIEIAQADTGFRDERPHTPRAAGPFAQVPIPLQWLGLAAGIFAAVVGIRSVYREWNPSPAERVAGMAGAPGEVPETSAPKTPISEETHPSPVPSESAPVAPPPKDRDRKHMPASEPLSPDMDRFKSPPRTDPSPPPAPTSAATPPEGARSGAVDSRASTGMASESAAGETAPSHATEDGAMIATGALPSPVVQVRVASERLSKQGLRAEVRDQPRLQATFVFIRRISMRDGEGESGAAEGGPRNEPRVSGLQNERPLPQDPAAPGGSRDERRAAAPEGDAHGAARAAQGGASLETTSQGGYYVRTFIGFRDRTVFPGENGYLAQAVKPIALSAHEIWGTPKQQGGIQDWTSLRSLVAIDGAHLDGVAGSGATEGSVMVAAAGRVYEVGLKGAHPGDVSAEHTVMVRLARKFPAANTTSPATIEIPLLVRNGAVAVLCVPDSLISSTRDFDARSPTTFLFVAVSPRFAAFGPLPELAPFPKHERGNDVPLLLERNKPRYPDDARQLGVKGDVVLEMTVLRDGGVYGVHVVSLPDVRGAELLIEPASSAVRRWRFLPGRVHGEAVDAAVRTTLTFGMDDADGK